MPKRKPAPSTTDTYGSDGGGGGGGFIDDHDGEGHERRKTKKAKNGGGDKDLGKGKGNDRGGGGVGKGKDGGNKMGKGEVFWEVCAVYYSLGTELSNRHRVRVRGRRVCLFVLLAICIVSVKMGVGCSIYLFT